MLTMNPNALATAEREIDPRTRPDEIAASIQRAEELKAETIGDGVRGMESAARVLMDPRNAETAPAEFRRRFGHLAEEQRRDAGEVLLRNARERQAEVGQFQNAQVDPSLARGNKAGYAWVGTGRFMVQPGADINTLAHEDSHANHQQDLGGRMMLPGERRPVDEESPYEAASEFAGSQADGKSFTTIRDNAPADYVQHHRTGLRLVEAMGGRQKFDRVLKEGDAGLGQKYMWQDALRQGRMDAQEVIEQGRVLGYRDEVRAVLEGQDAEPA